MGEKSLIKKEIITSPDYYFSAQSKTLDERLKNVTLSENEESDIVTKKTKEVIVDKTLGLFKVGELINTILNWNKQVDEDLREAKKEYLLASYLDKQEENELAISTLKNFLTSPTGNTLFNKILRILDDSPPDKELVDHLGKALQHIANSDFEALFEEHKYALSQIERLSPQALTILSDFKNWPQLQLNNYMANGPKITSDWLTNFVQAYSRNKNITRQEIVERISHSTNELIKDRFIEAHLIGENLAACKVTQIGNILLPYIH